MAQPIIAIVGGLNMDFVLETDRMPDLGESKDAISSGQFPGGKGANTAVAAVRATHTRPSEGLTPTPSDPAAGVKVYFNSAVGKDSFGPKLIEGLQEKGVDVSGVQVHESEPSGTCVVLVEIDYGESRNIGYPGAYMKWKPSIPDSIECLAAGHRPDLVMASLDQPRDVVEQLLATAYNAGVPTLLNPSPPYYLASHIYETVTHLMMNESETALLTGLASVEELGDLPAWEEAAAYFLELGVQYVVITLGKRGAYFATADGKKGVIEAVKDVKVADTTGAGDTFNGNYAVEYVEQMRQGGFDIERAISRACKAAARTVEQLGCQESIPWKDELATAPELLPEVAQEELAVQQTIAAEFVQAIEATHIDSSVLKNDVVPVVNGVNQLTPPLSDAQLSAQ